jgi:hypothetical protein
VASKLNVSSTIENKSTASEREETRKLLEDKNQATIEDFID